MERGELSYLPEMIRSIEGKSELVPSGQPKAIGKMGEVALTLSQKETAREEARLRTSSTKNATRLHIEHDPRSHAHHRNETGSRAA